MEDFGRIAETFQREWTFHQACKGSLTFTQLNIVGSAQMKLFLCDGRVRKVLRNALYLLASGLNHLLSLSADGGIDVTDLQQISASL